VQGRGIQFRALQTGRGGDLRAPQEEVFLTVQGNGTIILDGKRIAMPEGTIVRVGPTVYRAIGNDSNSDVVYMILGAIPPRNFPLGGRTLLGDGIPNRKRVPRWKKGQ